MGNTLIIAAGTNKMPVWFSHLLTFGKQQALSCLFPVLVFSSLALSHLFAHWLPRYDFMLLMCLLIQIVLYLTKTETKDEVLVICIFH